MVPATHRPTFLLVGCWRVAGGMAKLTIVTRAKSKPNSDKTARDMLQKHACPVPFHVVRARFLGNIAAPDSRVAPLRILGNLWGGELPPFDNLDDLNELIDALINGLWNALTRHQKRSEPFRLTRLPNEPTAENLGRFALVRQQELEGFIDGLFDGRDKIDLPERAHQAMQQLEELRDMMAGICALIERDTQAESRTELQATFKHLRELTGIMETEINAAVLSCNRARRQMLDGVATERPSVH